MIIFYIRAIPRLDHLFKMRIHILLYIYLLALLYFMTFVELEKRNTDQRLFILLILMEGSWNGFFDRLF